MAGRRGNGVVGWLSSACHGLQLGHKKGEKFMDGAHQCVRLCNCATLLASSRLLLSGERKRGAVRKSQLSTSAQVRVPAEFKHIIKRRKRN